MSVILWSEPQSQQLVMLMLDSAHAAQDVAHMAGPKSRPAGNAPKSTGIGKDPTTQTAFLPDKDREQQEQHMREQLKQEYELRQQVCRQCSQAALACCY